MSYTTYYIYDEPRKAERSRECLRRALANEKGVSVILRKPNEYGTITVDVRVNSLRNYMRVRDHVLPRAERRCKL